MLKICKIDQNLLPAGTDMVALFKKSTFLLLLCASQSHFLLGSPNLYRGTTDVGPPQTRSTNAISTDAYYRSYYNYNNYPFYHPFYQLPNGPSPYSYPYPLAPHHPPSNPAHQRPIPIHQRPIPTHQRPIPVHHPQVSNVVSHLPASGSMGNTMLTIFLNEHNKVRSSYGAPELVWNPGLVPAAKRVTDTCTFRHTANNQFGENIAAGQTSPQQVVSQWVNGPEEKSAYDPNAPRDSHFTQVVWHETREIGCAVTSCTTLAGASLPQSPIQFWACEYNPPGNVDTLYLKNVHATAGGEPIRN